MASGDRRLGLSGRRGMTVLGKIPAVPRPINLPSQRLENRGLDPSVEIVPRGTFSWGSGRSPPTANSSWGSVALSSSPPVGSGAWGIAATNSPAPSNSNSSGIENQPRPLSAGNTRPLSAGALRPAAASTTVGRAWGGAMKLEEQAQSSRFNLTNADFPTLGSEKDLNWQPQQTSNRPTSADAAKERHVASVNQYQSAFDRPTSADATKERQLVLPGGAPADPRISADGTHLDKGRQQSAFTLPTRPPFADRAISDQRHLFFTGAIGHGSRGPGPGTFDGFTENVHVYPVPAQQTMPMHGQKFMFPIASQRDLYFNRPGGCHANGVVVLPVDVGPEVYGSYAFDSRPNQSDKSTDHHPRATWETSNLERARNHQNQFSQSGPPGRFHVMQPTSHGMETAMLHESAVDNRRDGFGSGEEQRAGWAGSSVIYINTSINANESAIPLNAGSQKLPRPEMFLSAWGHQPMPTGSNNMSVGGQTVGSYQEMPSPVIHQHAPLVEAMRSSVNAVNENFERSENQTTCSDDIEQLSGSQGQGAAASSNHHTLGRKDVQHSKLEGTVKTSTSIKSTTVSEILRNENRVQAIGALPGTQPIKAMQEDQAPKAEQNRESLQTRTLRNMVSQSQEIKMDEAFPGFHQDHFVAKDNKNTSLKDTKGILKKKKSSVQLLPKGLDTKMPNTVSQSQEVNTDENFQGFHQDRVAVKGRKTVSREDAKDTLKKKESSLEHSPKGLEETDLSAHDKERGNCLLNASDGNSVSCIVLSSGNLLTTAGKKIENGSKDVCQVGCSETSDNLPVKSSTKELTSSSASKFVVPVEEKKAPPDDGSKTKRNVHSVRHAHGEPHSVDRQHVKHGMVWTPKPAIGDVARDEVQLRSGDAGVLHAPLPMDGGMKKRTDPMDELDIQGEIHVQQQMQLTVNKEQRKTEQGQELSAGTTKRSSLPVRDHRAEGSSKKQGQKVQHQQERYNSSKQSVQDGQTVPLIYKDESSQIKYQQSLRGSRTKFEPSKMQINRSEAQLEQNAENADQVDVIPVFAESESKKHSSNYAPKASRNQHLQRHEQEYEARNNHHGLRDLSREEMPVAEGTYNPACDAAALSAIESKKGGKEAKSRTSRNTKQHKGELLESGASSASEGPLLSGDRSHGAAVCDSSGPSFPVEVKGIKDKEERTRSRKLRQHEIQTGRSSTKSHQEHTYGGEDLKADILSSESSSARAEKVYIPKQARKQYLPQDLDVPGSHGPAKQHDIPGSQDSQPSGIHATAKKRDLLRYTPLPARKKSIEGQQCMAGSQPGQRTADSNEMQKESYVHAESELACAADSAGKEDDLRSYVMDTREKNRLPESFESVQSKKENEHSASTSGGKQHQSSPDLDEEGPRKEKWQRSHRVPASDSVKRKERLKPSGGKHEHGKQKESFVGSDRKTAKETGMLHMPKRNDLIWNDKQEKIEANDHFQKDQNHPMKPVKSTSLYTLSKGSSSTSEYRDNPLRAGEFNFPVSRVEETNDSIKGHKQDKNSACSENIESRHGSIEAWENRNLDDPDVAKSRQTQRRHYQYQPVAQHLQTGNRQLDASNTQRSNNRQMERSYNRYERSEGPRQKRGQAYCYRATEHADSANVW